MLKNIYHRIVRAHSDNQVNRIADIPGVELAINPYEILNPILSPYLKPKVLHPQRPKVPRPKTMDDFRTVGRGPQVYPHEFPRSDYIGEAIR